MEADAVAHQAGSGEGWREARPLGVEIGLQIL